MKKGQVTVFIIVGIVLLMVIGVGYQLFSSREIAPQIEQPTGIAVPVHTFVEECSKIAAKTAVKTVSMQGGYIDLHESTNYFQYNVPYYYNKGILMPTISKIQEQMGKAAALSVLECVGEFETFTNQDYSIELNEVQADATISESRVDFIFNTDIHINKDGAIATLPPINTGVNAEVQKAYNLATKLIEEQSTDPYHVHLSYLMELVYHDKLTFETVYGTGNVVYLIINNRSLIDAEPYIYAFAVKYPINKRAPGSKTETVPGLIAEAGYEFTHKLDYPGDYADYTELFNISDTGEISFIPSEKDAGVHEILIIARDDITRYITLELEILTDNEPPLLKEIDDMIINISTESVLDYEVTATDTAEDVLLYNIETSIPGLTINTLTGAINHDFATVEPGYYRITVVVSDIKGSLAKQSFNLEVQQ